jgi:hypothetical protein
MCKRVPKINAILFAIFFNYNCMEHSHHQEGNIYFTIRDSLHILCSFEAHMNPIINISSAT